MIKALIIDDEPASLSGLESLLKLFCPTVNVIGVANSVESGVAQIRVLKPDLVFLDIELRDGTGFDILDQAGHSGFSVIFITAYDHYAVKAFRLNAADYLLKPVDPDQLVAAVSRIKQPVQPDYTSLVNGYKQGEFTKIGVPGLGETIYLELSDIIRMESSNNYTYIHCVNARPMLISKTIKSFEELLSGSNFIRCHQRHIINLDYVRSYLRNEGTHLLMDGNEKIPVSRANKSRVDSLLKKKFPSI